MQTLKIIVICLEVLVLFNLLIFVHEFGHFLAARWRGLKVERFAIWFGKPIWKRKVDGVEYCLGCIPAGGYVSLPQMASMEAIEGKSEHKAEDLPPISPLDKTIVAFAGPLFSFLLALAFAVVVWQVGKPANEADQSTTIGWVDPEGPGWTAGLRPGDTILEVDGHRVSQFFAAVQDSVTWRIVASEGSNIPIKYVRDGKEAMAYPVPYKAPNKWYERKALRKVLIAPVRPAVIYEVATNSPADCAGLRRGDEIVALNGEKIHSFQALVYAEEMMTNQAARPVKLTVRRGSEQFDCELLAVRPARPADSPPSFGILAFLGNTNVTMTYPTPWEQIRSSVGQIASTLRTVSSRKSDVGVQQLGGPVMIIRVYKNMFESEQGWRLVLWFSVVLNVNLALLNLLPFPVLDGGHITLAVLEVIGRRPVSGRILNYLQSACAVALIAFMLFIAFYDTGDWVRSARSNREPVPVFAPSK